MRCYWVFPQYRWQIEYRTDGCYRKLIKEIPRCTAGWELIREEKLYDYGDTGNPIYQNNR